MSVTLNLSVFFFQSLFFLLVPLKALSWLRSFLDGVLPLALALRPTPWIQFGMLYAC